MRATHSAWFVRGLISSGVSQPPKLTLTPTDLVKKVKNTLLTPSGFTTNRLLATHSVQIDWGVGGLNPPPQPSNPTISVKI